MCGIAVASSDLAQVQVKEMLARLGHRGPDEYGQHQTGRVNVGHSRLSVIAPESGSQPLVGEGGVVAVCNGEIYNHRQLLPEGQAGGSDAAVLLPLFAEKGARLVEDLDGMYAFVIATDDGEMVAGRDPLGIKPLYRAEREGAVGFASEMKALMDSGWDRVDTVPAGHVWEKGRYEPRYRIPAPNLDPDDSNHLEEWIRRLRRALESAVVKRLMSDVPLGAFLSGGLDSSVITALAARHVPGLATFSLGFEGSEDVEAARRVADHLGTEHHEITVSEDEPLEVLPEVLYHLESWDRDLVRSALPTYLVARFAAEKLKVVLTGEGADELFAGYRYHAGYEHDPERLQRELHRSVAAMHDSNLQRVDRMTMAHSLEARVPFLDPEVVEVAMQIPAELKLRRDRNGVLVEKWILRRAFQDLLPAEIVRRTKSQFDEGSGTVDRLVDLAASAVGSEVEEAPGARLRDVEEAWYFQQLRSSLSDWRTVRDNTSVWTEGRL